MTANAATARRIAARCCGSELCGGSCECAEAVLDQAARDRQKLQLPKSESFHGFYSRTAVAESGLQEVSAARRHR